MVMFSVIFLVKMVPVSTKCSIIDFRTGTGSPLWHTRNNFGFLGVSKAIEKLKLVCSKDGGYDCILRIVF